MRLKQRRLVLLGTILLLAIVGGVLWIYLFLRGDAERTFVSRYEERFAPSLAEFMALKPPAGAEQSGGPEPTIALRPKVVAVDVVGRRLDPVHDQLPDSIRAESPDEVGTVVLIECKSIRANEVGSLSASYRIHCTAFFVDRRDGKLVATRYASKSPPMRDGIEVPFIDVVAERPVEALLKHVLVKFDLK